MNIYKVTIKQKKDQPFWDDNILLIIASNYSNAEDKAKNFRGADGGEIAHIQVFGETTYKDDVFILRER